MVMGFMNVGSQNWRAQCENIFVSHHSWTLGSLQLTGPTQPPQEVSVIHEVSGHSIKIGASPGKRQRVCFTNTTLAASCTETVINCTYIF